MGLHGFVQTGGEIRGAGREDGAGERQRQADGGGEGRKAEAGRNRDGKTARAARGARIGRVERRGATHADAWRQNAEERAG